MSEKAQTSKRKLIVWPCDLLEAIHAVLGPGETFSEFVRHGSRDLIVARQRERLANDMRRMRIVQEQEREKSHE